MGPTMLLRPLLQNTICPVHLRIFGLGMKGQNCSMWTERVELGQVMKKNKMETNFGPMKEDTMKVLDCLKEE